MSAGKYIPPHLRNKKGKENEATSTLTVEMGKLSVHVKDDRFTAAPAAASLPPSSDTLLEILSRPCHDRCKEFLENESQTYCEHHEFLSHQRTIQLAMFYQKCSPRIFSNWLEMKRLLFPKGDPNINHCFQKRRFDLKQKDESAGIRYSSSKHAVPELFERFLRYAIDIDNGTGYLANSIATAKKNGAFSFCDIGFAPGGMSSLLLDAIPDATGVGINLDPSKGGNVYPARFDTHERFQVVTRDVIGLARDSEFTLSKSCDFFIVGITTSGSSQKVAGEMDELELKNLLHFSQLLVAFRNLKRGGSLLIRMHLSLRLVDAHLLAFLFENFKGPFTASKPLSEFAMRKTFWVLATDFSPCDEAVSRLESLIEPNSPAPYATKSATSEVLNNAILMSESEGGLMEKYGEQMVKILEPMWSQQTMILDSIVEGLQERVCFSCKKSTSTRPCYKCSKSGIAKVLQSVMAINERLRSM